jgi:hypothetical protein
LFSQTIDDLLQRRKKKKENPIEMSLVYAAHMKIQESLILFGLWKKGKNELSCVWFKKRRK